MSFMQASAALGQRRGAVLSADNPPPERHIVIDLLRNAAPLLGLKPPVLATLEAMLSCLAPQRRHHTVFASNATLAFRRDGISDRTIRRHAALLQEHGLLQRHDSPNRKRYSRHSATEGTALRFGFDLSPLFERLAELAQMAAAAARQKEQLAYLRCKLRSAAQASLIADPDHALGQSALKHLRRKLSVEECETLLSMLAPVAAEGAADATSLSASDGQFVRHHQRSTKELTDLDTGAENKKAQIAPPDPGDLSVGDLIEACPQAAEYAQSPIRHTGDVVAHARFLAPMLGIDGAAYRAAQDRLGPFGAAVTIWAMLGLQDRIRQTGAYFRALTSGAKSDGFDPFRLVRRLRDQRLDAAAGMRNCPRTT